MRMILDDASIWFDVCYLKLFDFCYLRRILGHDKMGYESYDRNIPKSKPSYNDWH